MSAALVTVGVVVVLLVPLGLIGVLVVKQALGLVAFTRRTLAQQGVPGLLAPLPDRLARRLERALAGWSRAPHGLPPEVTSWQHMGQALGVAAGVVGSVAHLALMLALMLVALFFLLRDGAALIRWAERTSTLPEGRLRSVLLELRSVSRSLLGAQLGSGLIQAAVATIGYAVAGVPSPLLFGVVSLAASFIPIGGVSLVGVPLAGLVWLMGRPKSAAFLVAWIPLATGLVDYVVRPLLVGGRTHIHGALVFFALVGGIFAFGPIGIVVGPLALALFLSVSAIQRREREGLAA